MVITEEIRWFFKDRLDSVEDWFSRQSFSFQTSWERTDFYLQNPNAERISIKLRDNKTEVKVRIGQAEFAELTSSICGKLGKWQKWSFELAVRDMESADVLHSKPPEWIEVKKMRKALNLIEDEYGQLDYYSIDNQSSRGCQVEYSRLQVLNEIYFSFCLEYFGAPRLEIPTAFFSDWLGDREFLAEGSFSYPQFLINHFPPKHSGI